MWGGALGSAARGGGAAIVFVQRVISVTLCSVPGSFLLSFHAVVGVVVVVVVVEEKKCHGGGGALEGRCLIFSEQCLVGVVPYSPHSRNANVSPET